MCTVRMRIVIKKQIRAATNKKTVKLSIKSYKGAEER